MIGLKNNYYHVFIKILFFIKDQDPDQDLRKEVKEIIKSTAAERIQIIKNLKKVIKNQKKIIKKTINKKLNNKFKLKIIIKNDYRFHSSL